jgi:SAM-dependent methyltransferase
MITLGEYMNINGMLQYWKEKQSGELQMKHLIGKKVIDIGCGSGDAILDKENWIGIENSEICAKECENKGIKVFHDTFKNCSFEWGSIDGITAHQLLEHLTPEDAQQLFVFISRHLKPEGIAYISSPLQPVVWNTMDHIRPYPPSCIEKFLKQEKVYHKVEGIEGLEIEYFIYTSSNRVFAIIANILPLFRDGYFMKIRKSKGL